MLETRLDHLAITAPTLEEGCDYVRARLGVAPGPGGRHPRMGTHNRLLGLGPGLYLEVLAVDPEAPPPTLPRWFRLDQLGPEPPRLAAWIARTSDIHAAARMSGAFGRVEPMTRGELRWEITLPEGGALPFDGIAPLLIQWQGERHPAASLPDSGCRLLGLEGCHPRAEEIRRLLAGLGCAEDCRVLPLPAGAQPRLSARIRTPTGEAVL